MHHSAVHPVSHVLRAGRWSQDTPHFLSWLVPSLGILACSIAFLTSRRPALHKTTPRDSRGCVAHRAPTPRSTRRRTRAPRRNTPPHVVVGRLDEDRGAAPASTNRSGLRGGLAALARAVGVRFPRAVCATRRRAQVPRQRWSPRPGAATCVESRRTRAPSSAPDERSTPN